MKPSEFNYELHLDDGATIIYNILNRSFIEACTGDFERLQNDWSSFARDEIAMLSENGFLVEDDYDERAFLSYQFDRTRFAHDTFAITIAPTLNCNFACPYCYESARAGKLQDPGFEAIMRFITENYENAPFKKLQVNWYGGEPMLCITDIAKWSSRLHDFCEIHKVDYCSHMITNGSLIDEDNVMLIVNSDISDVQVTLDGWGDRHDVRRPARNGERQFAKIVAAVKLMAAKGIKVSCRMNVDATNIVDYDKLASLFEDTENVYVHVGHLRDYEALDGAEFRCFSCSEFSQSEFDLFERSSYSRNDLEYIFSDRRMFCGACSENSYVVDELCNVYKCWNDIGDDSLVIFNLLEGREDRRVNYNALFKYLRWNPFKDANCKKCIWLPMCGGGCVFESEKMGEPFCYPPRYSIDKYLKLYYKEVRKDETGQIS